MWSEPKLLPTYEATRIYLEINQRVQLLNQKVIPVSLHHVLSNIMSYRYHVLPISCPINIISYQYYVLLISYCIEKVTNFQVDVISDLLQMLKQQMTHSHSEYLEWIGENPPSFLCPDFAIDLSTSFPPA
jgi:hypothetical protein